MSAAKRILKRVYVLHLREYRETSLIAEVYSRDSGRLSVIFKGLRSRKSRYSGMVQPFVPISLSLFGRSDLKTANNLEFPERPLYESANLRNARSLRNMTCQTLRFAGHQSVDSDSLSD